MQLKRAVLSVVLFFLLGIIFIGPNQNSYHAYFLSPVLNPIFTGLEFGSPWSFYAPDPGGPSIRLEWEILDSKGEAIRTGYFPELRSPYFFNERQVRRLVFSRFLFISDDKYLNIGSSWLCRSNPDANSVRLWKSTAKVPDFYKVQTGEETIFGADFSERVSVGNAFCEDLRNGRAG